MRSEMLIIEALPNATYKVYVVWSDAQGEVVSRETFDQGMMRPAPKHTDEEFEKLLKAFGELKEDYNKLRYQLEGGEDERRASEGIAGED